MFRRRKLQVFIPFAIFIVIINLHKLVNVGCSIKSIFPTPEEIRQLPPHPLNIKAVMKRIRYTHTASCLFSTGEIRKSTILIFVKSAVTNNNLRDKIRITWGKNLPPNVILRFFLGQKISVQQSVMHESSLYHDIIQGDFIDSYTNNTLKLVSAYHYIINNCDSVDFVLFIDDDFVIDLQQFLQYVESLSMQKNSLLFEGYRVFEEKVIRDTSSKWYVSCEDFPYERWPPYLAGGAYLVSIKTVNQLYDHFGLVRYYTVDDAWLGMVAVLASVPHSDQLLFHSGGKYKDFAFLREAKNDAISLERIWLNLRNRPINRKNYFDDSILKK